MTRHLFVIAYLKDLGWSKKDGVYGGLVGAAVETLSKLYEYRKQKSDMPRNTLSEQMLSEVTTIWEQAMDRWERKEGQKGWRVLTIDGVERDIREPSECPLRHGQGDTPTDCNYPDTQQSCPYPEREWGSKLWEGLCPLQKKGTNT